MPDVRSWESTDNSAAIEAELRTILASQGVIDTPRPDLPGHGVEPEPRPGALEVAHRRLRRLANAGMVPSLGHLLDLDLTPADIQALGLNNDDLDDHDDADDHDAAGFDQL